MTISAERALVSRICGEVSDESLAEATARFVRAQMAAIHARDRATFIGEHDRLDAEMLTAWGALVAVCQEIDQALGGQQ
jgi:hypothetical protein